ncbi:A disintegrin and metalloproteinase with thrombospondin motifs 12-like [Diorhabda sublineata]|uniref:A disintegrin and metalloproteinase with thrombospondin motifs 12-like n=1 Tax=Diorhabda sublineata TaxID=1163346 RepID=UPI0024E10741|nr:A disintegrin and metalloproteinase with thrombospondin motifs 12-like [Diorhabda sublineata]
MITFNSLVCSTFVVLIIATYPIASLTPLNGRYTKSIENYKLIVPYVSDSQGNFVSFNLPNFYTHNPSKSRKKRTSADCDMVHYGLTLNGKDHVIDLWPNHDFISGDLIIEHRDPKLRTDSERVKRMDREKLCHYTGEIRGQNGSKAALSTCDGLAGYIVLNNKRYFIEPMAQHQPNKEGHHLHVVHQNSHHIDKKSPHCGTSGDWENAWRKRFQDKYSKNKNIVKGKRGTASEHRYLEILIVCDKKFITHHKDKDMENYIMTIMNMVSDFYHDASSGNQMDVVVVRIMYLEKEEEEIDLVINTNAEKTLESFCKWQVKINPKDINNPNHHDIAVLLTRYDICADEGKDCGLMGLAYVAAACTKDENCAINEDGGLTLGIVVAHEIGHVMGCAHDTEGESACPSQAGDESYYIMAPYVHMFTTRWSTCSRGFMTALFENNLGDCLNDEPEVSIYSLKNALPGTIYDAEAQCDIMFPGSTICLLDDEEFCSVLYCKTEPKSCASRGEPPADGTKCGNNKWCFHKKCVEIGKRPESINGGWGSWGSWSTCSRTCGGGVSVSERDCDNPVPQYGGRYCLGERKRYQICNKDPCPAGQPTFREKQCTEKNNKPYKGQLRTWKPYLKKEEPCVLYCLNEARKFAKLEPRVKDGTPCKAGTKNMCISGVCRRVGCDYQLDSDAVEDVCGICNGDGTQCKIIDEVYKDTGARDYKKVATIPQGSRNVRIEELAPSVNTIAITDKSEKQFYLNGNHQESDDGEKLFGKTEGIYTHPEPGRESLKIHGPTTEDLILFVCFYEEKNVGYQYTYAEPASDLGYSPHYHWELLEWSDCDVKCGGGTQVSKYDCVEERAGKVSSNFCAGDEKPEISIQKCNEQPCKTKWKVGKWGPCKACKNISGLRKRLVECVRENPKQGAEDTLVEDSDCESPRPASSELCDSERKCRTRDVTWASEDALRDVWAQLDKFRRNGKGNTHHDGTKSLNRTKEPKIKFNVGEVIKDRIPQKEIKLLKVPLKQSQISTNISDSVFESMGDSIGDQLDTGHVVVVTGKDAEQELKDLGHNALEKDLLSTTEIGADDPEL